LRERQGRKDLSEFGYNRGEHRARKARIRPAGLFGSLARGEAGPPSDIDYREMGGYAATFPPRLNRRRRTGP
jgi:hypothetical protein